MKPDEKDIDQILRDYFQKVPSEQQVKEAQQRVLERLRQIAAGVPEVEALEPASGNPRAYPNLFPRS